MSWHFVVSTLQHFRVLIRLSQNVFMNITFLRFFLKGFLFNKVDHILYSYSDIAPITSFYQKFFFTFLWISTLFSTILEARLLQVSLLRPSSHPGQRRHPGVLGQRVGLLRGAPLRPRLCQQIKEQVSMSLNFFLLFWRSGQNKPVFVPV